MQSFNSFSNSCNNYGCYNSHNNGCYHCLNHDFHGLISNCYLMRSNKSIVTQSTYRINIISLFLNEHVFRITFILERSTNTQSGTKLSFQAQFTRKVSLLSTILKASWVMTGSRRHSFNRLPFNGILVVKRRITSVKEPKTKHC